MSGAANFRTAKLLPEKHFARLFKEATRLVRRSVLDGDPLTTSRGQPVATGFLRSKWIEALSGTFRWELTTSVAYANVIETGLRSAYVEGGLMPERIKKLKGEAKKGSTPKKKSRTGGQHSVALTVAAWPRIVAVARQKVGPGDA